MDTASSLRPPRRALILAAGLGTRLRPLTWKTPKPLMTVWGVPLIDHAIGLLKNWGVESFAVNTHWRADLLQTHLQTRWPDTPFRVSYEPEILGTGGALLPLRDFFETEERFWIFNADVLASLDGLALVRRNRDTSALATLWLTDSAGPRTVETEADGRIATFRSTRPGTDGTLTFSGVHLVTPGIFPFLDAAMPASIVTAYGRAMEAGLRVEGLTVPGAYWADSGTPAAVLEIHRDVRDRAHRGEPGGEYYRPALDWHGRACVPPSATCAPTAVIEDCVLGEGSRVEAGVQLHHCLVGAHVVVGSDTARAVLAHPSDFEDQRVDAAVSVLGWSPTETTVEGIDARGSDRAFFRLASQGRRAILAVYGTQRAENARYTDHASALLGAGVPVPAVLKSSPQARWLVLDDLGNDDLLGRVRTLPRTEWHALYQAVIDTVVRLHRDASPVVRALQLSLEPAFDADVYRWERELFAEHMLRRRLGAPSADIAAILEELAAFSRPLEGATPVLVHRDLQSTNILFRDGRAHLIDFQGMRWGPAAYDLGSLLCDPYVSLPRELRRQLLADYAAQVPWGRETERLFAVAAAQRLVQALGAYARLAAFPGTERFSEHIAPAARLLLEETADVAALPHLRAVVARLANP